MAETCITYKKGEIAPVMVSVSTDLQITYKLLSATCEVRRANGELVVSGDAVVDDTNKTVTYAWDTTGFECTHYYLIFWINIDTDNDSVADYRIASEALKRYVRQVSSISL